MIKTKAKPALLYSFLALLLVALLVTTYFILPWLRTRVGRMSRLGEWMRNPSAHPDWSVRVGERCGVQDDGQGRFRNELEIDNTLDPSPYLGLPLNAGQNPGGSVTCTPPDESQ
jgi:hypothetical protein